MFKGEDEEELTQLDDVQEGAASPAPPPPQPGTSVTATDTATSSSVTPSSGRSWGKRKKNQSPTKEVLMLAGEKLKAIHSDDEFEVFGKYIAHKLRVLKGNQQIFARKLINDVIYEGELESLTKDFKVMNCGNSASLDNQFARPQNFHHGQYATPSYGTFGFPQSYPQQTTPILQNYTDASPPLTTLVHPNSANAKESNPNQSGVHSETGIAEYFSNFSK